MATPFGVNIPVSDCEPPPSSDKSRDDKDKKNETLEEHEATDIPTRPEPEELKKTKISSKRDELKKKDQSKDLDNDCLEIMQGEEPTSLPNSAGRRNYRHNRNVIENFDAVADDDDYSTGTAASNDQKHGEKFDDEAEEEEKEEPVQSELFTVDNAYRVLTPEEERKQQLKNAPLIEGENVKPRLTDAEKKKQQAKNKRRHWYFIAYLSVSVIILLIVILVPSLLLTSQRNGDAIVSGNTSVPVPSVSSAPSSFSPSASLMPSSFPTTNAPTSIAFADIVKLVGIDEESVSLDPNDYIFRTIQWMADVDQITSSVLQEDANNNQETNLALQQRFAMVSFFYATQGEMWFDSLGFMNASTHECQWQAFGREQFLDSNATITCVNDTVVAVALNGNNLGGMIPSEIGLLSQLIWLELRNNRIGSTLPSSLSQLSQLLVLFLDSNGLSGSIPSELTTLDQLLAVWLNLNALTGTIPESIGDLSNMMLLNMMSNMLSGSLPSSIRNMTMLQTLNVEFNMLTSSLPTQFNSLEQLQRYGLSGNFFTGTLPFEADSNPSLRLFECFSTNIRGNLSGLAHLSSVTFLSLSDNHFTGFLPTELCAHSSLGFLDGANNDLTGTLPDCMSDLTSLTLLGLSNNSLMGTVPILPSSLESLALRQNMFTGRIPTGPFPNLTTMSLDANNFTAATIPLDLVNLTRLKWLDLEDCRLSGTIHTKLGQMTQLTFLDLGANTLTRTIPTELGLLQNLRALWLPNNNLTGTIPSEIGNLTSSLESLILNINMLTGSLPSTFSNLPTVGFKQLSLRTNNLTGSVDFFCQNDRTLTSFFADCLELTDCTCCTACCDIPSESGECNAMFVDSLGFTPR